MKFVQTAALAALVVAAVATPVQVARAHSESLFFTSNGGFICKPANGVFTNFLYSAALVRNISASTQTLICNLPQIRPSVTNFILGASGYELDLLFANVSNVQVTVTCTALVAYAGMPVGTTSTATKQLVLAPSAAGHVKFAPTELVINDASAPVNVTCLLPSNVAFGRIDEWMP